VVAVGHGGPISVTGFTVRHGRIIEMNVLADPGRIRQLDLTFLDA
jgi:RNA polymerase sigma-70 factor (ECF subfamily)